MNQTPFYRSRTFWVNLVALLSLIIPDVAEWLKSNPVEFTAALGAVNILLRFVTAGKYEIKDDTNTQKSGNASDIKRLQLLGLLGASALLICGSLSSCGHSVTYTDDGLIVSKDGVTVTIHKSYQGDAPANVTASKK